MTPQLSALIDNELETHEIDTLMRALRNNEHLRRQWDEFHVVGAALRREPALALDITDRVMAHLNDDPVYLLPAARRRIDERAQKARPLLQPALALAASLIGVLVVAWVALGDAPVAQSIPLAAMQTRPAVITPARLQEYLLAHHAQATGATDSGTRYIRTVSTSSVVREGP